MSFQAYMDNIFSKTGKTPEDFLKLAKEKSLLEAEANVMPLVDWLKNEHGLGHGHAMAIVQAFKNLGEFPPKK